MEHRRGERLPPGRRGLCRVKSDPEVEWRHCRLIALSMLGLTIYVQHPSPTAMIGRHGIVEVSPFDDSARHSPCGPKKPSEWALPSAGFLRPSGT
jgi:hypothetical protein